MLESKAAMGVNEFCAWASISRNTFYLEVKAGRLRLRKIGRKSIVTMTDALDWLNALPTA